MFVNEQNKRKIIACLEAEDLKKDIKIKTRCTILEINSVIKELGNEYSDNCNLKLYEKVIARETAYEEEREKAKERALTLLEQNVEIKEVEEKTNLNRDEIRNVLKKLKKSGPEGEARYQKIQDNLKKQQEEQKQEKRKEEQKRNKEIIDALLDKKNKISIQELAKQKNISRYRINKARDELKESAPELHQQIEENLKITSESVSKPISLNREKENVYIAKLIIRNDLIIEHTAFQIGILPTQLYSMLTKITDENICIELEPILANFKSKWLTNQTKPKKSLKTYPKNIQQDIILTALTYHVPIELMSELFNTDIDDIYELYRTFDKYEEALICLNKATRYENEQNKQFNFKKAAEYWEVRNRLAILINQAQKGKIEAEKIKELKERLKEHHTLIGDERLVIISSNKFSNFTLEDREFVARYRLKYWLPINKAPSYLHLERSRIKRCEEELAEKDPIFAEELNILNNYFNNLHRKKQSEYRKTNYSNNNEIEEAVKENLETKKTLDYFHFNAVNPFLEDNTESQEFTRGGG